MAQTENKQQYDILISNPVNNHTKGKWSETLSKRQKWSVRFDSQKSIICC